MIPDLNLHLSELFCLTECNGESYQHKSVSLRTWCQSASAVAYRINGLYCGKLISSAWATEFKKIKCQITWG